MRSNSGQIEMLSAQALTLSVEAQEEVARSCHNKHEALVKCFINSGLTPGQVYPHLGELENGKPRGRSQGWFSKFMSGDALLNPAWDEEQRFMRLCGNLIPLRYDVFKTKHQQLVPIMSGLEEQVEELRRENADLRRAFQLAITEARAIR